MDIYFSSDNAILSSIGQKVRLYRTGVRLTQRQVAERAHVALSAVGNIENGKNVSLLTLLQVLRVIQALHLLEPFTREEPISPNAVAKYTKQNPTRQRVYKKATDSNVESEW